MHQPFLHQRLLPLKQPCFQLVEALQEAYRLRVDNKKKFRQHAHQTQELSSIRAVQENALMAQYNDYAALGPYEARIIADENSVLFIFTQRDLFELTQKDPDIFYEFVNVSHMSIAQMGHRLSLITNQRAITRVTM